MLYDPAKVLDPDLRVRAANAYQSALDYAQARLDASAYADFLALLASLNIPTDSDQVLTIPNATQFVDAVRVIAMHFVTEGGRYINVSTVTSTSSVIADLQVRGNLDVLSLEAETVQVAGSTSVAGAVAAEDLTINGDVDLAGIVTIGGRAKIGVGAPDPGDGGLSTAGSLHTASVRLDSVVDSGSAVAGQFSEDSSGDIYYKSQGGVVKFLNRPKHDTGWMVLGHACIGITGIQPPVPASTPDIYASTPMTLTLATPGASGGPVRVAAWIKVDKSLVDGGAATSTYYYFPVYAYPVAGVQEGVAVFIDSVTKRVAVNIGANELVPGQPGINLSSSPVPEIRVMIWTR